MAWPNNDFALFSDGLSALAPLLLLLAPLLLLLQTMVFAMARDGPSPSATQAFIHTAFLPTSTPAQRTNSPARSREAATIKERDLEARYSTHYAPRPRGQAGEAGEAYR